MTATLVSSPYHITWEKLPDDFKLPDDPVDNIKQPALAAALTESLALAGKLSDTTLTMTNYGVCATLNQRMVVKAPDWGYVARIWVSRDEVMRSYTPHLQGEVPTIVMEFLSDTEGTEYSVKPSYPPGKWFFYEKILKVPTYATLDLETGELEVYRLTEAGEYELQEPNDQGRYWIPQMDLFLGTWQGTRENLTTAWLRWWNASGNLLLWGSERVEQEQQSVEQERQRAEQERQRAEQELQARQQAEQRAEQERQRAEQELQARQQTEQRAKQLADRLRQMGIDPDRL